MIICRCCHEPNYSAFGEFELLTKSEAVRPAIAGATPKDDRYLSQAPAKSMPPLTWITCPVT